VKQLAIVVLNWNGLGHLRKLLPSLAACRPPEGWGVRVLVVDNGSTDGSVDATRREFPTVELLALDENRRFAGGNNEGVKRALAAGADAVMLLNNDTLPDPGLLEGLVLALQQDPGAGAAAPLIYYEAPSQRIWYAGGICVPALGLVAHRGLRAHDRGQYRATEATGYLTGCCLLARREVWESVGLLDERYHIYAEDADWCLRAQASGYRLLFVPTARLWHMVSATTGQASPWKIYQRLRANLTLFARNSRGLARLTWLPSFVVQQKLLMLWLLARGHGRAAMAVPRALWDAAIGKPPAEVKL
jgi:GT2 family glycosyltransferase